MNYTVFQISIDELTMMVADRIGRSKAIEQFPVYKAYYDTLYQGSDGFKSWMSDYYRPVCDIDASDLNQVYEIGNIGPDHLITRRERMHSVSVGDIIRCNKTNTYHMVDSFGFSTIDNFEQHEQVQEGIMS